MLKLSSCALLAAMLLATSGVALADAPGTAPSTDHAPTAPVKKKHHHHHKAKSHKKAADTAAPPPRDPHGGN